MASAAEAAARIHPDDTLGLPLGPGQPPAFLRALGERDDWTELHVYGALLAVGTELFTRDGVHLLSGFYGPFERALRDGGAGISFAPADFRRFAPLYERQRPRVMCTVASTPDGDGWCSLSLHAGGSIGEIHRAGADPDRLLVVETSGGYPRTAGLPPEHPHRLHVDEADLLIESDAEPLELPASEPTDDDRAIAANAAAFIESGSTIQTGIGAVPSMIATIPRRR
jgi:acyl-CoA hydrolase